MEYTIICMDCGEELHTRIDVLDNKGTLQIEVEACQSFKCTQDAQPEDDTPIRLPYLMLARILKQMVVTVTYRKKNGDIRELTGFLGTNDLRHVDSQLHYFHELDENGVDGEIGGLAKTSCKCLMIDRMINVTRYDEKSGVQTMYEVEEYFSC